MLACRGREGMPHFFRSSTRRKFVPCSILERCWNHSQLDGGGIDITLYDSLSMTQKIIPLKAKKGLAWYTCGPTTYAPAHLGHARTYVCLDIIRRILEHQAKLYNAPLPIFVMNITDIDDKIIAASRETGELPISLARRFETDFWKDFDDLNCLRPQIVTRVSEYVVSDIVPYIKRLCDDGFTYEIEDSLYFDIKEYEAKTGVITKYGKLAPPSNLTNFFSLDDSGNGDKARNFKKKKDLRDFVLWKKRKDEEEIFWDSPWGQGRPGWHIECSAMIEALSHLFKSTHRFQVHAGGVDLKFPHHTNEIAQAEAYHAKRNAMTNQHKEWIPHWVHTGHLHIDGFKMSKSLKNFITIQEMLEGGGNVSNLTSSADDFRLWCLGLTGSYRRTAIYSEDRLKEARNLREKIVQFLIEATEWAQKSSHDAPKKWTQYEYDFQCALNLSVKRAMKALANDLDGNTFVKEIISLSELGQSYLRSNINAPSEPLENCVTSVRGMLSLVGFSDKTVKAGMISNAKNNGQGIDVGEKILIENLIKFRSNIRSVALKNSDRNDTQCFEKILSLCDELRERTLPSIGIEVSDKANGTKDEASWKYCLPRASLGTEQKKTKKQIALCNINMEDFFRLGQYEGMFSKYDSNGIPLKHANGTDISKKLLKKLLKKRKKHEKRLSGYIET